MSTFYAISFVQSLLTTSLMAFRIWSADSRAAKYRTNKSYLLAMLRTFVESTTLQLLFEIIVLAFYAAGLNAQYIILETITPIVVRVCLVPCRVSPNRACLQATTFNAITVRIELRSSEKLTSLSHSSQHHDTEHNAHTVNTIGFILMRPIAINIKQDVEAHGVTGSRSNTELNFDRK
jgi:hypothetical protein